MPISVTGVEMIMRYLKYLALLGVFVVLAATHSSAQVAIGIHIGRDYGYYHVPPDFHSPIRRRPS